ncbi:right-handed parallel beta-helix repeat-containing protein [Geodermatophilus sp. SYSU D00703]
MTEPPRVSRRALLIGAGAVALGGVQAVWYLSDPPARQLSVRDFGAAGDGIADDGPALRRALDAARAAGPGTTLTLEEGRYRVHGAPGAAYALPVSGAAGLTIAGSGATIVVSDPALGCLSLRNCDGCAVHGLTVDYDPTPFARTTVTAVHPGDRAFDVEVAAGQPLLDAPFFTFAAPQERHPSAFGAVFDPGTGDLKSGVPDFLFVTSARGLGRRSFRLRTREDLPTGLSPGDVFVYLARQFGHAVLCSRSSRTTLREVHVRAANAAAFALTRSDATRITGCTVGVEPGSNRLLSSNGDGVHAQACREGPTVEDCVFEGMMDDGLNVYAPPMDVLAMPSDRDLLVAADEPVRTGDRLEFSDPVTGRITGARRVAALSEDRHGDLRLRLDSPVPGLSTSSQDGVPDAVFNLSASGEGYVVRGNRYRSHRGHALRLHTGRGSVEGNHISRTSREAILISNDPDWPEGPHTRDLVVRDNTVEAPGGDAGIEVQGRKLGRQLADEPTQRGLRVHGNTVRNWQGSAIAVGSAREVAIHDNVLVLDGAAEASVAERGVLLDRVEDVEIDGLVLRAPPGEGLPVAVEIAPTVATEEGAVRVCALQVPAGVSAVRDRRLGASVEGASAVLCSRRSRLEEAVELAARVGPAAGGRRGATAPDVAARRT